MQTLSDLVAASLAEGLTYRALAERAVDPESGYRPSLATLHKLGRGGGEGVNIHPKLVAAVAAGLGIPVEHAARAAAFQFAGYIVEDPVGGDADEDEVIRVARRPGSTDHGTAEVERFVRESRNQNRRE